MQTFRITIKNKPTYIRAFDRTAAAELLKGYGIPFKDIRSVHGHQKDSLTLLELRDRMVRR